MAWRPRTRWAERIEILVFLSYHSIITIIIIIQFVCCRCPKEHCVIYSVNKNFRYYREEKKILIRCIYPCDPAHARCFKSGLCSLRKLRNDWSHTNKTKTTHANSFLKNPVLNSFTRKKHTQNIILKKIIKSLYSPNYYELFGNVCKIWEKKHTRAGEVEKDAYTSFFWLCWLVCVSPIFVTGMKLLKLAHVHKFMLIWRRRTIK